MPNEISPPPSPIVTPRWSVLGAGNDHVELARRGTEVAAAEEALATAEERWLGLADEADSAGLTM